MLCMLKMLLKQEVGGRALNSHGNLIVIMENHGIVFLNFFWNSVTLSYLTDAPSRCLTISDPICGTQTLYMFSGR